MDCRSASAADCVRDCGLGVQWPNDRKPIFFMQVSLRHAVQKSAGGKLDPLAGRNCEPEFCRQVLRCRTTDWQTHSCSGSKPARRVAYRGGGGLESSALTFFLLRTGVPPGRVAYAVRAEVERLDPDVTLENFTELKATFEFRRDRMDREHSEMGKHAAVAPLSP